jgi:NCS1 family nucleobase:cation symporter-1
VIDGESRATGFRIAPTKEKLAGAVLNQATIKTDAKSVIVSIEGETGKFTKEIPVGLEKPAGVPGGMNWGLFFTMITAMVGFWATLSLNIPDFTRYAKNQKSQILGQAIGLPPTMGFYAFIGIVVTCAAVVIFKDIIVTEQAPWDPVALLGRFDNPTVVVLSMIFLAIATLTTNIAANVVSPANDFSNLKPRLISFKTGGMITACIGILMMPWKLVERPDTYIFTWLIGYSALLGPIAGILIADYYVLRKRRLELPELYREEGIFRGINFKTLAILFLAVLPNLPGFLANTFGIGGVPGFFMTVFQYSWFVGFGVAFVLYALCKPSKTISTVNG